MSTDNEDDVELSGSTKIAQEGLLKFLVADDEVFVCTDVDGIEHDIARLYAVSKPGRGALSRLRRLSARRAGRG